MREPAAKEVQDVEQHLPRPDRREGAPEVTREDAVDQIDNKADEQEPHCKEMPEQRAGKSVIVMDALGALVAAIADGEPGRKSKAEQRLLIVDLPSAADQDDDPERPGPMRVAHSTRMQDHVAVRRYVGRSHGSTLRVA